MSREDGFVRAVRTPHSGMQPGFDADVMHTGRFFYECKADENMSVWAAVKQAEEGAVRARYRDWKARFPVAWMRRSRGKGRPPETVVAMPVWVFRRIVQDLHSDRPGTSTLVEDLD